MRKELKKDLDGLEAIQPNVMKFFSDILSIKNRLRSIQVDVRSIRKNRYRDHDPVYTQSYFFSKFVLMPCVLTMKRKDMFKI